MASPGFTFPPGARVLKKREFEEIFAGGRRCSAGPLRICAMPRPEAAESRVGIAISRKFGCAVRRNRYRRLIREVFRLHRHEIAQPTDVVVTLAPGTQAMTFGEVEQAFRTVVERINTWARRSAEEVHR